MIYRATLKPTGRELGINTLYLFSALDADAPLRLSLDWQDRSYNEVYRAFGSPPLRLTLAQADVLDEGKSLYVVWVRPTLIVWWGLLDLSLALVVLPLGSLGSLPSVQLSGLGLLLFLLADAAASRWIVTRRRLGDEPCELMAWLVWLCVALALAPTLLTLWWGAVWPSQIPGGFFVILAMVYLWDTGRTARRAGADPPSYQGG